MACFLRTIGVVVVRRGAEPLKNGGNERIADFILASSFGACFLAAPIADTAAGGFIFHTALASAVGGAADWFAVHSLFRKPLGIPFQTELIPKSRDKIIEMARDMMTKELFTRAHLYHLLKTQSVTALFAAWLAENRDTVRALFLRASEAWISSPSFSSLAESGEGNTETTIRGMDWAQVAFVVLSEKETAVMGRPLLASLSRAARLFLQNALTDEAVRGVYEKAWETYEGGGHGRAMLRSLLASQLGLTDEKAVSLIQEKAMTLAVDLENPESIPAKKLSEAYRHLASRLASDTAFREKVNAKAAEAVLSLWKGKGREKLLSAWEERKSEAAECIADEMLSAAESLLGNSETRKKIDRQFLFLIFPLLPYLSEMIGQTAADALSVYSGRDMAEIAEKGVWHDLQMIRINGSVIGAFLGGISYLAFYFASGGGI